MLNSQLWWLVLCGPEPPSTLRGCNWVPWVPTDNLAATSAFWGAQWLCDWLGFLFELSIQPGWQCQRAEWTVQTLRAAKHDMDGL